jgi:NADH-quinone oxidoreductase subunit L
MLNTFFIISVFLPLLSFCITSLFKIEQKNKIAPWFCTVSLGISFFAAITATCILKFGNQHSIILFNWIKIESFKVNWGLFFDSLSLTMLLMITLISFLVHVYSFGYMSHDENKGKFFSLLSLFTFFMLILISAPNLLQLFFGWEGVGLASYLLIGFWHRKKTPPVAAMKAFIVNRVGDLGLIAAIGFMFYIYETLDFVQILPDIEKMAQQTLSFFHELPAAELIAFSLILAAMGKSAQFGLHTWLPDAMEGPTPVSALIHAATMVTAGVFLICRFSPLLELAPHARFALLIIGTLTAFFAATIALTQTDIKKIVAYSTCSQLGYMMMACGISAYNAAMFHLVTHAFFKALLFLGAGSVIHAMSDEQNIEKMGGLYKLIPFTFVVMVLGSLAIAGIPFFAGSYSKDAILHAIYHSESSYSYLTFIVAIGVVFLTAFYSWRLLILVFHHELKSDEQVKAHVHDAPFSMRFSLVVLAIGAVFSGILGQYWYMKELFGFTWGSAIKVNSNGPGHHEFITGVLPVIVALFGIVLSYIFYFFWPSLTKILFKKMRFLHNFLYNKWYIDELYEKIFVKPCKALGVLFWIKGDELIDKVGPEGITKNTFQLSQYINDLSTGKIYHMIGTFGIVLALFLSGYLLAPFICQILFIKG